MKTTDCVKIVIQTIPVQQRPSVRRDLSRTHSGHSFHSGITREELQCIQNLTDENIQLKRVLKTKSKELAQKTLEMEAVSLRGFPVLLLFSNSKVQGQLDRICKVNATLRQKNTFSAGQTQRLMEEKLDLEVQLKEKENVVNQLKERVASGHAINDSPTVSRIDCASKERFAMLDAGFHH